MYKNRWTYPERKEFGNDQAQMTDASLLILMTADLMAWAKELQRYWQNAPKEVAPRGHHWGLAR
jgi:hypothetical protein